jgi:uncharacterized protein (TIGR02271 family)
MSMQTDVQSWVGRTAVDTDGEKVGKIDEVYLDRVSGQPEWLTIKTGLFGSRTSFVPLRSARLSGDDVSIGYTKAQVKDAPNVDADGELSDEEERRLYDHYGQEWGDYDPSREYDSDRFSTARTRDEGTVGHDTSGPTTDDAMTRSEEELRVSTERREAGRARLRKYVVTEQETVSVPVQREEVRIEREPITDANRDAALDGPDISEEEHEVVLHEDAPVVDKQVVPKERVRMETDTRTEDVEVNEQVRKERIDADGGDVR